VSLLWCIIATDLTGDGKIPRHKKNEDIMQTMTEESQITLKTKELCQAILDQPSLRSARQRIEKFMTDEKTRAQYDGVMAKGQALQQKQQRSVPLTGEEISAFEKDRDALLKNPVAREFLDAQEELHQIHESVNQYVSKTLELGRVPTEADLDSGSCGQGCGCGHNH
jgi:cell fate (sporulation/competence/biofilm development) regulator YlbF (YheA/YmcA/DUF963 family)